MYQLLHLCQLVHSEEVHLQSGLLSYASCICPMIHNMPEAARVDWAKQTAVLDADNVHLHVCITTACCRCYAWLLYDARLLPFLQEAFPFDREHSVSA